MKKLLLALLMTTTIIGSCQCTEKKNDNKFTITVTGAEHFPDDIKVLIWRSKPFESPERVEYIAAEGFTNGKFVFEGEVDEVHIVTIDMAKEIDAYPYSRVMFPLEPADITIDFTAVKAYNFKGGKYGELLVNSWNNNADYQKAVKEFEDYKASLNGKSYNDIKDKAKRKEYAMAESKSLIIKQDILREAINNSKDDPLVELLAYGAKYYGDPGVDPYEVIEGLANKVGLEHRQSKVAMLGVNRMRGHFEAKKAITVGTVIKDFEAKNLEGETFHLADVLKSNKYVLVEFWASWCGPCRQEIPHMKKAYSNFKDKGFEIVSFTLDSKKEKWEEASEEEQIPWINTGDLLAQTSPVVKLYGVAGVPANYLVEASTGKIIAINIRGEALDHKLEELLSK